MLYPAIAKILLLVGSQPGDASCAYSFRLCEAMLLAQESPFSKGASRVRLLRTTSPFTESCVSTENHCIRRGCVWFKSDTDQGSRAFPALCWGSRHPQPEPVFPEHAGRMRYRRIICFAVHHEDLYCIMRWTSKSVVLCDLTPFVSMVKGPSGLPQ